MSAVQKKIKKRIGFMQGRFSPLIHGKIQAFPWPHWRDEFELAGRCGFHLMEWTLDQDRLYENPLMTEDGQEEVRRLTEKFNIAIPSLTGDCFMQSPFYKAHGKQKDQLLTDLKNIIEAVSALHIKNILVPLVDNGRLENKRQENDLLEGLFGIIPLLEKGGVIISFESDFPPEQLACFIDKLDARYFGITYDIGNSASLGYQPEEEIRLYGYRVVNVHVKDRMLGGTTVPLGTGNADIFGALRALHHHGYGGNYILQTARSDAGDHAGALCKYRNMVADWLEQLEK